MKEQCRDFQFCQSKWCKQPVFQRKGRVKDRGKIKYDIVYRFLGNLSAAGL